MSTLSEMGLRHGGRIEVELVFGIQVAVAGKGQNYRQYIEVGPNEKMDIIRSRVPFFHMFSNRNYQVICPQQDNRVYDTNELNTLLFRDSNLKNGNELLLKEPEKSPTATRKYQEEDNSDGNEGEEPQSEDPENDEQSLDSEEMAIREAE